MKSVLIGEAILISMIKCPDKDEVEILGYECIYPGRANYLRRQVRRAYKKGFHPQLKVHNLFPETLFSSLLLHLVSSIMFFES